MNTATMTLDDLVKEYKRHNHLYWVKNAPEISDQEFDEIELRIRHLSPNHSALDQFHHSPINTPVKHSTPMLSMEKAYGHDEILKWATKTGDSMFIASPKMDGTACSIRYYKGKLVQAATRGKGDVGEDITQNVLRLKNVPKTLPTKESLEVRGEVIMPLSVFNKNFKNSNSNARNLAAGSLKQKDADESEKRGLVFYAYNLIGTNHSTEKEKYAYLRELGFRHVDLWYCTLDKLQDGFDKFNDKRGDSDYEIDGVIFCANDVSIQESLGSNSHHPRYAIAWKIQGESATTVLKDIEWSISRTGVVTPVAIVEPVNLSGASVGRSTIHHAGFVLSKKLSKGATIEMTRRGGVIPHVERVVKDGHSRITIPTHVDGHEVEMIDDFLYLKNPEKHPEVQVGRLTHFCKVIEADGFGDKIIRQLYNSGEVTRIDQFFTLTAVDILNSVDRSGTRMATKLVSEMCSKSELELHVFLRSLGIDELGKSVSKVLAKKYKTIDRVRQVTRQELENIDGIGDKIADAVVLGLHRESDLIDSLLKYIRVKKHEDNVVSGKFSGKSFVFTGTLSQMGRKEAQKVVQSLGGEIPSSVSKDLTYLVVGGNDTKSSKYKKATSLNGKGSSIQIISEDDFIKMTK